MHVRKTRVDDGRGRFCSKSCVNTDRKHPVRVPKVKRICKHCGETFWRYASSIKPGEGKFCSRSCTAAHTNRQARFQKGPTSIEQSVLDELNRRNIQHEFQYPLTGWTIDFAFPEQSLAVEADGVYWHNREDVKEKDKRKDASLREQGWRVLHFSGDQIRESPPACVDEIVKVLNQGP